MRGGGQQQKSNENVDYFKTREGSRFSDFSGI